MGECGLISNMMPYSKFDVMKTNSVILSAVEDIPFFFFAWRLWGSDLLLWGGDGSRSTGMGSALAALSSLSQLCIKQWKEFFLLFSDITVGSKKQSEAVWSLKGCMGDEQSFDSFAQLPWDSNALKLPYKGKN